MARTWQPLTLVSEEATEGRELAVHYKLGPAGKQLRYTATLPGGEEAGGPVEAIVGGGRHGLGFLLRVSEIGGVAIARPVLVQAREAWSAAQQRLVLAPGCPEAKPDSFETAIGIPLSPEYERRCLECHGKPGFQGNPAKGGVGCESCHGPGSGHIQAVANPRAMKTGDLAIKNPAHLSAAESVETCAACHKGLTSFADPQPEDLLVANQTVALQRSRCYRESGGKVSCVTCHSGHRDAPEELERSREACRSCHNELKAASGRVCPVQPGGDCLRCHMPAVTVGPFHLVDHQIRAEKPTPLKVGEPSLLQIATRGRALLDAGRFGDALTVWQQATIAFPTDANSFFNLGRAMGRTGRMAEATEAYKQALTLDGDFVSAYLNLGRAQKAAGNRELAIDTFRQGLRVDPLSAQLYLDLADLLTAKGDRAGARDAARAAAALRPEN